MLEDLCANNHVVAAIRNLLIEPTDVANIGATRLRINVESVDSHRAAKERPGPFIVLRRDIQ